jgi:hypothetical protein
VQRSYLLVLWVQVLPLQFSVWQCSYLYPTVVGVTLRLKARKVCEPVRMTLRMTKTVPITEKKGNGKEVCRLADEVVKRRSWDNDVNTTKISKRGSNLFVHLKQIVLGQTKSVVDIQGRAHCELRGA